MNLPKEILRTNMVSPWMKDALADNDFERFLKMREEWFETLHRACLRDVGDCWIWNGKPYPQLTGGIRLHRLVATILFGDISGQSVHHKCGNNTCVNPDHIQLVSRADNTAEMLARHDYERFIVRCLKVIKFYNPNDPILRSALPGNVEFEISKGE